MATERYQPPGHLSIHHLDGSSMVIQLPAITLQMCSVVRESYPSRLINVSPGRDSAVVKLVQTESLRDPSWASLSYCWGGPQHAQTTRSNVSSRYSSIQLAQLPTTIRDAVKMCRILEIPHLWVDSLCIIQDDVNDQSRELAPCPTFTEEPQSRFRRRARRLRAKASYIIKYHMYPEWPSRSYSAKTVIAYVQAVSAGHSDPTQPSSQGPGRFRNAFCPTGFEYGTTK